MALTVGTNCGFVEVAPTADPNGTAVTSDGSSFVVKATSPQYASRITSIGWYKASGTTSSNFQVGLYSANGAVVPNEAGTRLQVSSDAASGTTAGWKVITGLNWTISGSTAYWLGVQQDAHTGTSQIDMAASGGAGIDTRTSQTALTNPYGGGALSDADGIYAIYATYMLTKPKTITADGIVKETNTKTLTSDGIIIIPPSYKTFTADGYVDDHKRYWVGGSGDWTDATNHWAITSGGSPNAAYLPTSSDDVFIDSNSGFGDGGTLLLDDSPTVKNFISQTGHTYTISGSFVTLDIIGNTATFESGITLNAVDVEVGGSSQQTLTSGGVVFGGITIVPDVEKVTLADSLTASSLQIFGDFDANDKNVTANYITISTNVEVPSFSVWMGNGTWKLLGDECYFWISEDTNSITLYAEGSTVDYETGGNPFGGSLLTNTARTFNKLKITSGWVVVNLTGGTITFSEISNVAAGSELTFGNFFDVTTAITVNVTTFDIAGSAGNLIKLNTYGYDFIGGISYFEIADAGSGYEVDDVLTVSGGDGNAIVTVTEVDGSGAIVDWDYVGGTGYSVANGVALTGGTGTGAEIDIIEVNPEPTAHTLSMASGTVECDYLDIAYSEATGGATWYAGSHSVDGGNNSGWIFIRSKTITADGLVKAVNTNDITSDGLVKATQTKTFTSDGVVAEGVVQYTETVTSDGVVIERKTSTISSDGIVKQVAIETITSDAIVAERKTKTFTSDSIVKEILTETVSVGGYIAARTTKTITSDGVVRETFTETITTDGIIRETNSKTFTANGIIQASDMVFLATDGIVRATYTETITSDAIVKQIASKTITVNGIVKEVNNTTISSDGIIKQIATESATADGVVKVIATETFTVDGITAERKTATITSNALIKQIATETVTIDAIVAERTLKSITVDGLVKEINIETITTDGIVRSTRTETITSDGVVRSGGVVGITSDGIVFAQNTKDISSDGVVKEISIKSITSDGIVTVSVETNSETFTVDGIIKSVLTETITSDGVVKTVDTKTFVASGIIKITDTESVTADGVVSARNTETITSDGVIKSTETETITSDGIVSASNYTTITSDGIVYIVPTTKDITADGVIFGTMAKIIDADGYVVGPKQIGLMNEDRAGFVDEEDSPEAFKDKFLEDLGLA